MNHIFRKPIWAYLAWGILLSMLVVLHTITPHHEETRYLGVAWEMTLNHHWALPLLNGQPYPDKPPLLFWLLRLGWMVFGVNAWWPRVIPVLAAFAALYFLQQLSKAFWPDDTEAAWMAPLILLGTFFWAWYLPYIRFDVLLVAFTLLAFLGLLRLDRQESYALTCIVAGVSLGILTKGPVIFLYVLPPILTYHWWSEKSSTAPFYKHALLGIVLGIALAACWFVPAAIQGGAAYRHAIFWGQEAGRVTGKYSHGHWYYYLEQLPLCLMPWILWPRVWQGVVKQRVLKRDTATVFIGVTVLSILLLFSVIAEKGNRYVLVIYPLIALLIARVLSKTQTKEPVFFAWFVGAVLCIASLVLWVLPSAVPFWHKGWQWYVLSGIPIWFKCSLLLAGLSVLFWRPKHTAGVLSIVMLLSVMVIGIDEVGYRIQPHLDLHHAAKQVSAYEKAGRPVAFVGQYIDQFHFFGRLRHPLNAISVERCTQWATMHPNGVIVKLKQVDHSFQASFFDAEKVLRLGGCH